MRSGLGRTAVLVLALFGAGCGIGNTHESISWDARLDTVPAADCVKDAVAATPGVTLAAFSHDDRAQWFARRKAPGMDHYYLGIPALHTAATTNMGMHIGRYHSLDATTFNLSYGYWPRGAAISDAAAAALIANISARCGVPELQQRVKMVHRTGWDPYFFNV